MPVPLQSRFVHHESLCEAGVWTQPVPHPVEKLSYVILREQYEPVTNSSLAAEVFIEISVAIPARFNRETNGVSAY